MILRFEVPLVWPFDAAVVAIARVVRAAEEEEILLIDFERDDLNGVKKDSVSPRSAMRAAVLKGNWRVVFTLFVLLCSLVDIKRLAMIGFGAFILQHSELHEVRDVASMLCR